MPVTCWLNKKKTLRKINLYPLTKKNKRLEMSKKAVVLHHGRQFELEVGKETVLPRVEGQEGEEIVFKDVLAVLKDDGDITVGAPKIEGASVSATIVKQYKGKKILIFKKKRRKGYKKKQGYRESLSRVQVKDISL